MYASVGFFIVSKVINHYGTLPEISFPDNRYRKLIGRFYINRTVIRKGVTERRIISICYEEVMSGSAYHEITVEMKTFNRNITYTAVFYSHHIE